MDLNEKIKLLEKYAEEANKGLEEKDRKSRIEKLNSTIEEMFNTIPDSNFYFSRDVYLFWNGSGDAIKYDLLDEPERYKFMATDDPEEHPGIIIHFKDEKI